MLMEHSDHPASPQCPKESHLPELLLVALLLMFIVLHHLLATLELQTAQPNRHRITAGCRKTNARKTDKYACKSDKYACKSSLTALYSPISVIVKRQSSLKHNRAVGCGKKKTVRFAEMSSVQCIQPAYGERDFYDDPLCVGE